MDEHKEKVEDKFRESPDQQQQHQPPREREAEEEEERNYKESMDPHHQDERKSTDEEPAVQLKKEVETGPDDEAWTTSPPLFLAIFAHPWSLLQYLLRACAGWFWGLLHGAFNDGPKPPQQAFNDGPKPPPEAVAPANSTTEQQTDVGGGGGGQKANNYFYMQEVVTRVWAVRRGRPQSAREGAGGNGGSHN